MRVPDRLIALFLFLVSLAVYLPSIEGEFVFDDHTQIEGNQLIQRPEYFGKALRSDVFAFRSESHLGGSPYWRPGFILWLIANYAAFGIDPTGWHVASLSINGLAVVLAYFLIRRTGGSQEFAGGATLLFAMHPAHVESVAWISGATDPLLAVFYLGSLLLLFRLRDRPSWGRWAVALGAFACALSVKEPAIFFPLLALTALRGQWGSEKDGPAPWRTAFKYALPFAGVAAIYLACRFAALQGLGLYDAGVSPLAGAARNFLTAPGALLFYLRQSLLPLWIAPAHDFRAITPANANWVNFAMSLAGLFFTGLLLERLFARNRLAHLGAGLFFFSLAAALNVAGFGGENIVHDRYLYLPLLGVAVMAVSVVEALLRRTGASGAIVSRGLVAGTAVLSCVLGVFTVRGQETWSSNAKLWDAAAASDPGAVWVLLERSVYNLRQGKLEPARIDAEAAYRIKPFLPEAILHRADIAIHQARYTDAIGDLRFFLEKAPLSADARIKLGIALQRSGQYDAAVALFREGRDKIPARYASFTQKIAVVLAQSGKAAEAIHELEAIRSRLGVDQDPDARLGLKFLGFLYREAGRTAEALDAEEEFLRASEGMAIPAIVAARAQVTGGF